MTVLFTVVASGTLQQFKVESDTVAAAQKLYGDTEKAVFHVAQNCADVAQFLRRTVGDFWLLWRLKNREEVSGTLVAVTLEVHCSLAVWKKQSKEAAELREAIRGALLRDEGASDRDASFREANGGQLADFGGAKILGLDLATDRCLEQVVKRVFEEVCQMYAAAVQKTAGENNAALIAELLCNLLPDAGGGSALRDSVCTVLQTEALLTAVKAQVGADYLMQVNWVLATAKGDAIKAQLADTWRLGARTIVYLLIAEHYVAQIFAETHAESVQLVHQSSAVRKAVAILMLDAIKNLYPPNIFSLLCVAQYGGSHQPKNQIIECISQTLPTVVDAIVQLNAYAEHCKVIGRAMHGDRRSSVVKLAVPSFAECSEDMLTADGFWLLASQFPEIWLQKANELPNVVIGYVMRQWQLAQPSASDADNLDDNETAEGIAHRGFEHLEEKAEDALLRDEWNPAFQSAPQRLAQIVLHLSSISSAVLISMAADGMRADVSYELLLEQLKVHTAEHCEAGFQGYGQSPVERHSAASERPMAVLPPTPHPMAGYWTAAVPPMASATSLPCMAPSNQFAGFPPMSAYPMAATPHCEARRSAQPTAYVPYTFGRPATGVQSQAAYYC